MKTVGLKQSKKSKW